jgi:transposase-like protein
MSESHQQRRLRWQAIVQQYRDSGQTIAEFVRANGLCRQKFYAWRRRFESPPAGGASSSAGEVPAAANQETVSPAFVRVVPTESPDSDGGSIEVRLRRRRRVLVRSGFDRTLLIGVVRALEEA